MMIERDSLRGGIVKELRAQIVRLPPNSAIMSNSQLCKAYGISPITASRVIKQLAGEGLVYCRKGSGTYVADRAPGRGAKVLVAFHMPGGDPTFVGAAFGAMYEAIVAGVEACGRRALGASYYDLKRPDFMGALAGEVCGVIASISVVDAFTIPLLDALAAPVVTLQQDTIVPGYYSQVLPDIENGFYEAMRYFRGKGLGRLGIVGLSSDTNEAKGGVARDTALRAGFAPASIRFYQAPPIPGDLGRLAGRALGHKLLAEAWVDCVFAVSDFIAFGVLDSLFGAGLKPGELPLISFDDLEGGGLLPFGEPLLSSISLPRQEIAFEAAKLLNAMVESGDRSRHVVMVPTAMTLRKTA